MTYYVAVSVGCTHCGEPVELLGIFTNEDHALDVAENHGLLDTGEVWTVERLDEPLLPRRRLKAHPWRPA